MCPELNNCPGKLSTFLEEYLPLLSEPFECIYLRLNQSLLTKQIQHYHVVLQVDLYEGAITFHQLSHKLFAFKFYIYCSNTPHNKFVYNQLTRYVPMYVLNYEIL